MSNADDIRDIINKLEKLTENADPSAIVQGSLDGEIIGSINLSEHYQVELELAYAGSDEEGTYYYEIYTEDQEMQIRQGWAAVDANDPSLTWNCELDVLIEREDEDTGQVFSASADTNFEHQDIRQAVQGCADKIAQMLLEQADAAN